MAQKKIKRSPFQAILAFASSMLEHIESKDISLSTWLITFGAVLIFRPLLESLSSPENFLLVKSWDFFFFHLPIFYMCSFFGLILLLRIFTKGEIQKIANFVLFLFPVILLAPVVDLLIGASFSKVMETRYLLFPDFVSFWDFCRFFLQFIFMGPYGIGYFGGDNALVQASANYGIRLEVNIIVLFAVWYTWQKTNSLWKMFGAYFSLNAGLFFISFFPYVLTLLGGLETSTASLYHLSGTNWSDFGYHKVVFIHFLLITLGIITGIWFFENKKTFFGVLKNFRITRTLNHLFLLGFGIILGFAFSYKEITYMDGIIFICAAFAMMFEWFAAVCYNDITDEKGDAVAMVDRPLITGVVSKKKMMEFAVLFFLGALYISFPLGYVFFLMVFMKSALSYLYSSSFFRLKTIPIVANFILASAYLLTVVAGYVLVIGDESIFSFPKEIIVLILVSYTFASTFKDIKDYEGDKIDGICTIPVIFGLEKGKKIIGVLGAASFLFVPFILSDFTKILIFPSVVFAILYYVFATRKNYKEIFMFLTYFGFSGVILTLVIFSIL